MPNLEFFQHTLVGTNPAMGVALTQIGSPLFVLNKDATAVQGATMGIGSTPDIYRILDGTGTNATNSIPVVVPDAYSYLQLYLLFISKGATRVVSGSPTGTLTVNVNGRLRETNKVQRKHPCDVFPALPDVSYCNNNFGYWAQLGVVPANGSGISRAWNASSLLGTGVALTSSVTNWTNVVGPDTYNYYLVSLNSVSGTTNQAQPYDVKGYDRVMVMVTGTGITTSGAAAPYTGGSTPGTDSWALICGSFQ